MQALDLVRSAVDTGVDTPAVVHLGALACVRMGATDDAEAWLARIDRDAIVDPAFAVEVWGLAGRIAKDRYVAARSRGDASAPALAREAIDRYARAFELGRSAYPAVNAATLAALAGDHARATALARDALALLQSPADHWQAASAGEACLALGRIDDARAHYADARRRAGARYGDVASMRRQLRMIGTPPALALLDVVPAPHVIAFSGHMIDRPGRTPPRFPPSLEPAVAAALHDAIARLGPSVGYAQAACGADILFLEAMHDAGCETQVVLPFAPAAFVETSVAFAGARWVERFERALACAARVLVLTDEAFTGDDALFDHAGAVIQGMAFLRARDLEARPLMLTLRDADAPALVGGTTATMERWRARGGDVETIDLVALLRAADLAAAKATRTSTAAAASSAAPIAASRDAASDAESVPPPARVPASADVARLPGAASAPPPRRRSVQSLLFADISGFSKLPEQYTPDFAERFLGTCRRLIDGLPDKPVTAGTQGDGLFLVYDAPSHAARFAIALHEALAAFDWTALGMPAETGARIGLHTGPLFRIFDPVTEKPTFYGTHVNRAARLEPIVLPRQTFATEEFAASLVAERDDGFVCEYIGVMPLAKRFGDARLYRLRAAPARQPL